jgi:redox-sensitive bicupin YhaK (pirin superfamily)
MTAGRGIVHSEMPEQETGRMAGFQLWVNLPAKDKMCAPRYQDIAAERIPSIDDAGGAIVKVIAGSFAGATGPVDGIATDPLYLDVALPAGRTFEARLPQGHNAFLHVHDAGAARVVWDKGARKVARGELAVLGPGEALRVEAENEGSRFILVAGRPLREPIAKYGPFVMTSREEIIQAIDDFREGRF